MRFAFLSDIHGNATALEAVIHDIRQQEVDQIFILGDICFRGPEPKRSLDLVRSLDATVIKGNADEWLVKGISKDEVPEEALAIMNEEREWTLQRLEDEDLEYLANLPTELVIEDGLDIIIHAFHATPNDLLGVVLPDETEKIENEIMQRDEADLFVYGHTHLPFVRSLLGKNVANTGSVGMPFDGHPLASYLIVEIEDGRHRLHLNRVPYNREHVVELYKQGSYPNIETMGRVIFYAVKP
ncbi:phosphodiesterase [Alkalihalobacillus alcalophilus ATCC 27647 = CGMCC 1.3604]|uniref:Phosphodiesterase n=1 Tax=Alkalihalobacillus alcalophilus ATCC 27647 = CGMCC 1.3604 TaxID=1218173 RepID=A0A094WSN4_ALKAL|nr:metallophosphoesterase family protein [Alkalihalobacillus alcalophilus]KGA99088.1 phosphodiesterase [Alkalihalobacillus alcalophilus ATCC 27647 = CGMCC 1.3604]MED1562544.1 metallophosphoesterase family protein [Alkalihalobacillus alcalophilus]THG90121.1 phosphodiesterase [Alkalihalobacillus alcalophilus ATCC 27647 = CGMCC 1.3604]